MFCQPAPGASGQGGIGLVAVDLGDGGCGQLADLVEADAAESWVGELPEPARMAAEALGLAHCAPAAAYREELDLAVQGLAHHRAGELCELLGVGGQALEEEHHPGL